MAILIEEYRGIIIAEAVTLLDHCELLLLLIKLHAIWIVLKKLGMLLKKQLLIRELLRLLDIGSSFKNWVTFVCSSTFICEVSLISIVLPPCNYDIILGT